MTYIILMLLIVIFGLTINNQIKLNSIKNENKMINEKEITKIEKQLKLAGCVCPKPLIGFKSNGKPRCRLCDTSVE